MAAILCGACSPRAAEPPRGPEPALGTNAPPSLGSPGPTESGQTESGPLEKRGGLSEPAWTRDTEHAGAITDGVALQRVRTESSDGVQRLVFEFDGSGPPPRSTLEQADQPNKLWLTLHGVRHVPEDLPLLTGEGGQRISEPVPTKGSPVVTYGRVFLGDDSAIRVELELNTERPHRLIASENPRQLTAEFQR